MLNHMSDQWLDLVLSLVNEPRLSGLEAVLWQCGKKFGSSLARTSAPPVVACIVRKGSEGPDVSAGV